MTGCTFRCRPHQPVRLCQPTGDLCDFLKGLLAAKMGFYLYLHCRGNLITYALAMVNGYRLLVKKPCTKGIYINTQGRLLYL